jgi:hypothetical protein
MAARSRLFISWYVISAAKVRISERKDKKKQIFFAFSGRRVSPSSVGSNRLLIKREMLGNGKVRTLKTFE